MMLWMLLALACGGGSSPDTEPKVDGWQIARDDLRLNEHNCFASMLAYCDGSEAFVDPILQEVLDRSYDGVMPDTKTKALRISKRARGSYGFAQAGTEEARAGLMKRVEAHYDSPSAIQEGTVLRVEIGVIPGAWKDLGRAGWVIEPGKKVLGMDWRLSEAVRFTRAFQQSHPTAETFLMKVKLRQIGGAGGYRSQTWTWRGSDSRLVLSDPARPSAHWQTDPITDWDAFEQKAKTMDRDDLWFCGGARTEHACRAPD